MTIISSQKQMNMTVILSGDETFAGLDTNFKNKAANIFYIDAVGVVHIHKIKMKSSFLESNQTILGLEPNI